MQLFKEILTEMRLLTEDANVSDINDAINGMLMAKITYDDGDGGTGERIICPVAYGMSTRSNPVVRAFQQSGPSKSGHKPNWRLFKTSNIKSWENIENQKYTPSKLVGVNLDGDKQMSVVYTIAKIGPAKDINIAKNKNMPASLKSTPVLKKDVNAPVQNSQEEKVDQNNYTATNAINDILRSTGNENLLQKAIDKKANTSYNSNDSINAQETKPMTVGDIPGGEKEVNNGEEKQQTKSLTSEPIKKTDLETPEEVSNKFKDIMNRMNNPEKEEDKNENDEENANK